MTTVDAMADEIMKGLTDYADLADTSMKKAVRKTAKSVKDEISANAPKRTGAYAKSWTAKKTKENSHSLEMTVHSKNRYQLAHLLEKGHAKRNVINLKRLLNGKQNVWKYQNGEEKSDSDGREKDV